MSNPIKENRSPNTECQICHKSIYRRPWELKKYKKIFCSVACRKSPNSVHGLSLVCQVCNQIFIAKHGNAKCCSRSCGNKLRVGILYNINGNHLSVGHQKKLNMMKDVYDFKECMVVGCNYSATYDIHRLIPGKDGGRYEIGNMFAICPNHHAEVTRKLIEFEKINDYTLKIK